jgi:hypothetical protein
MGNSPSVDQAMLALDDIQAHKRKERGSSDIKRAPPCRSKSLGTKKSSSGLSRGDLAFSLDDYDLKDIHAMIKELKRDSRGQQLLDEFVHYQTGMSTRKPRLLQLVDQSRSNSDEFDISDIQISN